MNNQYEINYNQSAYPASSEYMYQQHDTRSIPIQSRMSGEQNERMIQSNEISKINFIKNIEKVNNMNDQILGHRMSNMSSYKISNEQYDQPIEMDNQIASDQRPLVNNGLQQNKIKNARDCECHSEKSYCGICQLCGLPGHQRIKKKNINNINNKQEYKGQWCDSHYEREKIKVMKKNPSSFISYQASDPMHPERPPMTIDPAKRMLANKEPEPANEGYKGHNFNTMGQHKTPFLIHHQPYQQQHHQDRQPSSQPMSPPRLQQPMSSPRLQSPSRLQPPPMSQQPRSQPPMSGSGSYKPYEMTEENMGNFKGNNSFELNRTSIRSELITPREKIDYVGFNAQGEKIHDTNYYKQAPGRTNEHDHYREYKKYNQSGDYQPSNQSTIQQQYRSYQGNIPPKKMKLTSNYIGQTT